MSVFEYVYAYVTEEGRKGIVRADNKEEAIDRIEDCRLGDKVKDIIRLSDLDNDYGVIESDTINQAVLPV